MPTESPEPDLDSFLAAKVSDDLHERVRAAARRDGRTISSWLRKAVRRQLDAQERVLEHSQQ